jgi:hypothetical protein
VIGWAYQEPVEGHERMHALLIEHAANRFGELSRLENFREAFANWPDFSYVLAQELYKAV